MALSISTAKPKGTLTVGTAKPSGTLTVGTNTGMQGSNVQVQGGSRAPIQGSSYNPQPAAGIRYVQPAATIQYVQNAARVAAAAQTAAIARAAEAQRQAVAAAARAKEILRSQTQAKLDNKVGETKSKLSVRSFAAQQTLRVSTAKPKFKLKIRERTEYEKAYDEAVRDYEQKRQPGKMNFFSSVLDKVTFGQDRRDVSARKYAEQQAKKIQDKDFKGYETSINDYNKKVAKMQADVNRAATTMSQKDFDIFVQRQQSIVDNEFKTLKSRGVSYDARLAAYGDKSTAKLNGFAAVTLSNIVKALSDENPVWKYTLGSGDKNVPSIVTAPSRAVNFIGNATFNSGGFKNLHGGKTIKGFEKGENAWTQTLNQRNFNFSQPKKGSTPDFESWYKTRNKSQWTADIKAGKVKESYVKKLYKDAYERQIAGDRSFNHTTEFLADPLLGVGKAGKGFKIGAKSLLSTDLLKSSKPFKIVANSADKLKNATGAFKSKLAENKTVKLLGQEYQSPADKLFESKRAIMGDRKMQQEQFLNKVRMLSEKIGADPKRGLSIFDELQSLTPKEREILQRMNTNGGFALRDFARNYGRGMKPWREKMQGLARRYTDFTEQMRVADNIDTSVTAYGRHTKKIYSPRTVWADDLDQYNFRLFRKKGIQSGDDFMHGVVDRFAKSNLERSAMLSGPRSQKYSKQLQKTIDDYDRDFQPKRAQMQAAEKDYRKSTTGILGWMRNKRQVREDLGAGRAVFNTAKNIQSAPTRLWKKSVLSYRPAWTVNNVLYNTQAGVLAGGPGALAEQLKMLRPKYWQKSMAESREAFGSNLGKEIGSSYRGANPLKKFDSKLSKFYTGVEDWSRVAAGRAAMKTGLTEQAAQKRVNRYLFDYKTRNWERPIKAVVPFWSFQKNLARAAATMPFDKPVAALGYNHLDRYQQEQYGREFDELRPELERLGYSTEEIEQMKAENSKYFKGRLKVGDKWISTPFNAFSQRGLSELGINPWLQAGREVATAEDKYGRKLPGEESGVLRRIAQKFPQFELARGLYEKNQIDSGKLKPSQKYIGKSGHDGFGLGKEKQGYDPTKKNYVESMDPRTKLGSNVLSFLGVPKSLSFDKPDFIDRKRLQKVTAEYFKLNTNELEFSEAEAQRNALFKKYGITSDDFYNGILSKYDSDNTTKIKGMKREASAKNKALFEEYGRQPQGTRNLWVTQKLRELNDQGYFNDNPYLKSFKYVSPTSVAKADKQKIVKYALATGDWSKYRELYGSSKKKYARSPKALARDKAVSTGDWTEYRRQYGTSRKSSPYQTDGKYFKSAESMKKYTEGKFWRQYAEADRDTRKKLLAENPQYDMMSKMSPSEWRDFRQAKKAEVKKRVYGFANASKIIDKHRQPAAEKAFGFSTSRNIKNKKVVFLSRKLV